MRSRPDRQVVAIYKGVGSPKNCRCISQKLSLYARFFVSISKTALMSLIEIVVGLLSSHIFCRRPTF